MAAEALEQSMLESKDKDQLLAIAKALGLKAGPRTKKSEIIDLILETTGHGPSSDPAPERERAPETGAESTVGHVGDDRDAADGDAGDDRDDGDDAPVAHDDRVTDEGGETDEQAERAAEAPPAPASPGVRSGSPKVVLGADGEPLAEWELDLDVDERPAGTPAARPNTNNSNNNAHANSANGGANHGTGQGNDGDGDGDGENRGRRRRRRRKGGRGLDGQGGDEVNTADDDGASTVVDLAPNEEPLVVSGYLDLRDEGYGFLRVNGYLPSRDDAYVPVKLARQYGLRRGDHLTGPSRSAVRTEKNPALLDVTSVNGKDPFEARRRPRFEDLTALFPDQRLRLEDPTDPTSMTGRIIDLVSPIGKGQRGLIVSPPKAGKTMVMKMIAQKIEKNNPEVKLIVLLLDERPEEVTDIRRSVQGEVVASTFDRPSEEHTHIAELVIEKAKRMVEDGDDVVIILDGITRLARAYNLAAPASGKILSGGIDAGALYPPKKFFGAARNVEEGGSLTILATALVDTNSRMDEAIFEEFKGTGNMELRLDRRLAERRIYPAINVDASSTRHEELLFDRKQLQMAWKLRRVLSGLAADGNPAPGLEMLMDRLKSFRTNDEFLAELAKQSS